MLLSNKFLKSLDLGENHFTNEGLKEVLNALEKNDKILHIDISNNYRIDWSALKIIRNT